MSGGGQRDAPHDARHAPLIIIIIIIGVGPVGMMLALNLNALGVRSVVVNSEPGRRAS